MRKFEWTAHCGPRIAVVHGFHPPRAQQQSMQESASVLILAREDLISALLGLLVETSGHVALLPKGEEDSRSAIRRLLPNVIIVDCDHRDCTGDLVKSAIEVGARLILFSASREPDYVRKAAAPSRSQSFTFPIEPPRLDLMIRQSERQVS